jgi:hypothetical protein
MAQFSPNESSDELTGHAVQDKHRGGNITANM